MANPCYARNVSRASISPPPPINTSGDSLNSDCRNSDCLNSDCRSTTRDQHMRWLPQQQSSQQWSLIDPLGSTHEAITSTAIVSTAIIDWPPRSTHEVIASTAIISTVIVDWPPPRINTWGDCLNSNRWSTPLHFESLIYRFLSEH